MATAPCERPKTEFETKENQQSPRWIESTFCNASNATFVILSQAHRWPITHNQDEW